MVDYLRDQLDLNISDSYVLSVSVADVLSSSGDAAYLNRTLPYLNLSALFPDVDLSTLDELDIPIIDPDWAFSGMTLRDFLDGDLQFSLKNVMEAFDRLNFTRLELPVGGLLGQVLNPDIWPSSLSHNFTVIDGFNASKGKFGDTLGNVALIDCHYAKALFMTSYLNYFESFIEAQPIYYVALNQVHKQIKSTIDGLDFCSYALNVGAVLNDQVGIYTGSTKHLEQSIGSAGNLMMDYLTLDSNVTVQTPLKSNLKGVEIIIVFFNSIMSSIVLFLALLCT